MYLKEICTAGLVHLIKEAGANLNFDEHILPLCEASIDGGWEQCSPDTLYFLLSLQEIYKKVGNTWKEVAIMSLYVNKK